MADRHSEEADEQSDHGHQKDQQNGGRGQAGFECDQVVVAPLFGAEVEDKGENEPPHDGGGDGDEGAESKTRGQINGDGPDQGQQNENAHGYVQKV